MFNQESVLENSTHKVLWDFEIKTYHPLPDKRPCLVIITKRKKQKKKGKRSCCQVDITVHVDSSVKIKANEKNEIILGT